MLNKSLFSSENQKWETPVDLFKKLDSVFSFNIDVCASKENTKCEKYFTEEINGLEQDWVGNCWMNPPYGKEQVKWINKAYSESVKNNSVIVCLIPARPDTKVWHDIIFPNASMICFVKGRIKFGDSDSGAPFPSAIVVFNSKTQEQVETLKQIGYVI